jgi:predicted porin
MHVNKTWFGKVLVAVAMFVLVASARAQSSVTLYGVLDSGLVYVSKSLNPATGGNGGHLFSAVNGNLAPSVFGLSGVENLGGGVTAIFMLTSGIDLLNGGVADSNGNYFGRQASVGLAGDFGRMQMGVQYSPFLLSLISTDPRNVSYFGSIVPIYVGQLFATGAYNPNAMSYTTPSIAGFQGSAMLALGGTPGDFQAGRQYSASLTYDHGPLLVSAAMYSGNPDGTAATTPIPTTIAFTGRTLGAVYRFGQWVVNAVFVNFKLAGSFDNRVYGGGFAYQVNPALSINAGGWLISDGNDSNNRSIMVASGAVYSLSKATALYAQYGFVNNRGKEHIGLSTNASLYAPAGTTQGVTVGIRHLF